MKRVFLIAVCVMACMAVFTSCSKDNDEEEQDALECRLRGHRWVLDDSDKGSLMFYRNHLAVYLENKDNVWDALGYMNGVAVGTWRDRNGMLSSAFTSSKNTGVTLKNILPSNLTLLDSNGGVMNMEDDSYKAHTMRMVGAFEDFTDETIHDKALHGTWKMDEVYYSDLTTDFEATLHPEMTIYKDGTMRMVVPELNIEYTTTYTTKDGRVTFARYQITEMGGEETFVYVHEKNRLMFLKESSKGRLYETGTWLDSSSVLIR